jgi:ubiquinone/menaquinone biosynthesis C-methylase UbiE
MKTRESGMPDQAMWESFFDPEKVLKTLGISQKTTDVADFGCGYGTFTIPASRIIKGNVYALDLESDMVRTTQEKAKELGLKNVKAAIRDFISHGSGLADESVDYAMLFNILHIEHPEKLIEETWRILRKDGRLGIIHWNYDPSTPRGPSMEIRPKPEQCIVWAESVGFRAPEKHDLKPYHYGIVLSK